MFCKIATVVLPRMICRLSVTMLSTIISAAAITSYPLNARGEGAPLVECINGLISFDGVTPLRYATVVGEVAGRVSLHRDYPKDCGEADTTGCGDKAYLVSGDTVAIGKTCGAWAYIEFLGPKRVSVGWVASSSLAAVPGPVPTPRPPPPVGSNLPSIRFLSTLKKGKGNPVCEAYLQRLNQTNFDLPPYCGRPENTLVPGFSRLNRVWVPIEEINRLLFDTVNFIDSQPPNSSLGRIPFQAGEHPTAYGYGSPISIENDGTPQNVILWNLDNRDNPDCNTTSGPIPYYHRSFQVPIILSGDGTLDKERTQAVFGQPQSGSPLPGRAAQHVPNDGYAHLGNTYGIFEYRGMYYFDTFFDNGPHSLEHIAGTTDTNRLSYQRGVLVSGSESDIIENRLGVFIRHQRRTEEICEYQVDQ